MGRHLGAPTLVGITDVPQRRVRARQSLRVRARVRLRALEGYAAGVLVASVLGSGVLLAVKVVMGLRTIQLAGPVFMP